jgi:aspartate ammonia-lyase
MTARTEKDMLGEKAIPKGAYHGIHTARAMENFNLSGRPAEQVLVSALAMVKKACCRANAELKFITPEIAAAIEQACDEIIEGRFKQEFPVDALQGGAGTSLNMNINEVIANRALEILGHAKGDYQHIDPLDHVNLHQSTNDVYPTALKVATVFLLRELSEKLAQLQNTFQAKEQEFATVVKMGRTEMQDAVPITMGAEFAAFAEAFARDRWRTFKAEERIRIVNLGGTAVGTGLTAPRSYIYMVIEKLREITSLGLARGENCVDQTANADSFVEVSAIMKSCAVNFTKICRDLRQLHFIGEITLPPVQAGSSIMPGKVNPVILESLIQSSLKVCSYDHLVEQCAALGTLQINEYMPLLADSLLRGLQMLHQMTDSLTEHAGKIIANPEYCKKLFENNQQIITAFLPYIGYAKALELLNDFKAVQDDISFHDFLVEKLDKDNVERVLSPHNLTSLGYR